MHEPEMDLMALRKEIDQIILTLKTNEAQLAANGFDVDSAVLELEEEYRRLAGAHDRALGKLRRLASSADEGGTDEEFHKALDKLVSGVTKKEPFHPLAVEWEEVRRAQTAAKGGKARTPAVIKTNPLARN